MMESFVKSVTRKLLEQEYPHLAHPAVIFATITQATQLGQTFKTKELTISNDSETSRYKGYILAPWYEYELKVVDRFGNQDDNFPIIPGVRSKGQFEVGSFVAVAMAYGDVPVILGEVQL